MEKTTIEANENMVDKTEIENDITVIENVKGGTGDTPVLTVQFKDYQIVKQLPTSGAEADIYLVEKEGHKYILKLYRHEMKPSRDMIDRLVSMSEKYPEDIVKIYEIDKDKTLNRWYELQEYAEFGTLKDLMTDNPEFVKTHMHDIVEEMALLLKTIHQENIIHRDIKPDNLLVRTMEPLDLIITDFGISSVLDEEFSKKMTSKSGTRIYFAPESFSGVIGKEVDYWAMGMILLEIVEGDNIFRGEQNEAKIAHKIFTQGVEVSEDIAEDLQLLLKGLLTRDPKKRWGEKEIFRWLKGEKDIPVAYVYADEVTDNRKQYTFKNQKFYDLKTLLLFIYTEENYENAKEHVMRGYITKWLEDNHLNDDAILLDKLKNSSSNIDFNLFAIYSQFVQPEQFIFMGKMITLENLLLYVSNILENQATSIENQLVNYMKDNVLLDAYTLYSKEKKSDKDLLLLLEKSSFSQSNEELFYLIKAFVDKGLTYQFVINSANTEYIKNGELKRIYHILDTDTYVLPEALIASIKNQEQNIVVENDYLTEKEINDFLKNKHLFGLDNASLETIINDITLYKQVQTIVYRSEDTINFKRFAKLYKEVYAIQNKSFEDQGSKLILDELVLKVLQSNIPLTSPEMDSFENKIALLQKNSLKKKFLIGYFIIFPVLFFVPFLTHPWWKAIGIDILLIVANFFIAYYTLDNDKRKNDEFVHYINKKYNIILTYSFWISFYLVVFSLIVSLKAANKNIDFYQMLGIMFSNIDLYSILGTIFMMGVFAFPMYFVYILVMVSWKESDV